MVRQIFLEIGSVCRKIAASCPSADFF